MIFGKTPSPKPARNSRLLQKISDWLEVVRRMILGKTPSPDSNLFSKISAWLKMSNFVFLGQTPPPKVALDGRPPQNLPEWLEVATGNLVPSAQARVRPEIEAHYAEAVQNHLQNGSSESTAQATALVDLGDAQAAAKRFGQEHLTASEVKAMMALNARVKADDARAKTDLRPKPWYRRIDYYYLLLLAVLVSNEYEHPMDLRQFVYLAASILTLLLVGTSLSLLSVFLLLKKLSQPTGRLLSSIRIWRALKPSLMVIGFFTYAYSMLLPMLPRDLQDSFYCPLLLMAVFIMLLVFSCLFGSSTAQRSLRLRNKLLAAPEEREKIFPPSEDNAPPPDPSIA